MADDAAQPLSESDIRTAINGLEFYGARLADVLDLTAKVTELSAEIAKFGTELPARRAELAGIMKGLAGLRARIDADGLKK